MGEDPANELNLILEVDRDHVEYLAPIRHLTSLKMAVDGQFCWVKGLSRDQLESLEVKAIPFKRVFSEKEGRLYPYGHLLPVKRLPSALLWTGLERGLPLNMPGCNHNFFGVHDRLTIRLGVSVAERPPAAQAVSMELLGRYLQSVAPVRLRGLVWVVADERALVIGEPLLSLPGDSWWRHGTSFLPAGYDWEWDVQPVLDERPDCWFFWEADGSYLPILKSSCRALSLSSFRLTSDKILGKYL
jgi:hypothetical protein